MQEGGFFQADVYKRGLDAREYRFNPTEIDVADNPAMIGTVDQQLDQAVVLEDGHPGLARAPIDQDFALQASRLHDCGKCARAATATPPASCWTAPRPRAFQAVQPGIPRRAVGQAGRCRPPGDGVTRCRKRMRETEWKE